MYASLQGRWVLLLVTVSLTRSLQITCLYDMDIVGDPRAYNEVYLYEELMECDLAAIIR